MAPSRTLAIVLAGGAGTRLELLTEHRAKPVIPIAGSHRLIDVVLSNCAYAQIPDVWVIQQQHPATLADALRNGRPWDLDRSNGGLLVLPPSQGDDRAGWHQGTADALWKIAPLIDDFAPDVVLVMSSDAVYRLDYAELAATHLASEASVTIVTTQVLEGPERYGVVQVSGGRITDYAYKPDEPAGNLISNEVFAFHPRRLTELLDELSDRDGDDADIGDALLPRLVEAGEAHDFRFDGYWRDLGTVEAYWSAHMDFLPPKPDFEFFDTSWPMRSSTETRGAARLLRGADVADSLISGGAAVAGTVRRSVIGRGAVVERGADVSQSVILPGAVVRAGCTLGRAIVDTDTVVGRNSRVGSRNGRVALIGHQLSVPSGTVIKAGGRYPDADSH